MVLQIILYLQDTGIWVKFDHGLIIKGLNLTILKLTYIPELTNTQGLLPSSLLNKETYLSTHQTLSDITLSTNRAW